MPRPILVTSALPYASGPPHFGHLVGAYLPADVFVRWHRQIGSDVVFVCGTDEHGVAITLKAEQEGVGYQAFVDRWHAVWKRTCARLGIEFDNFSQTSRRDPQVRLRTPRPRPPGARAPPALRCRQRRLAAAPAGVRPQVRRVVVAASRAARRFRDECLLELYNPMLVMMVEPSMTAAESVGANVANECQES